LATAVGAVGGKHRSSPSRGKSLKPGTPGRACPQGFARRVLLQSGQAALWACRTRYWTGGIGPPASRPANHLGRDAAVPSTRDAPRLAVHAARSAPGSRGKVVLFRGCLPGSNLVGQRQPLRWSPPKACPRGSGGAMDDPARSPGPVIAPGNSRGVACRFSANGGSASK